MTTAAGVVLLFLGTAALLTVLSVVVEVLRARRPSRGVEVLAARVRTWWAMAILLALALLLGRAGVVVLFALAAFAALREFATYTAKAREDHLALALAFFAALPVQFLLVGIDWPGLFTIFIPVYVFAGLSLLSALRGSPDRFLPRVAETQWALMVCVYGASHVPALMTLAVPGNALLIPFLVLAVQAGEIAEEEAGRRLRGRRIAPALSPRTWAGAGAGVAAAALLGLLLSWLTPFGPFGAMLMAALAAAAALAGGLVLAAVKRERGVKDWSHLLPGEGGILDQWGGVFFAAPLFWHLTHYFWG